LGWNWDHNYNRRLQELPDGSLVYFDGAGRRDVFRAVKNEEGAVLRYEPPGGRFVETYKRLDGSVTMKDEKGVIEVYNALGRLTKIMDRNGNSLEFAYDLGGKLSTAMDTMGRLIQFEYYPWVEGDVRSGRLQSVGDFSGRRVIYSYDGKGDLAAVNFEGRETKYAYSTGTNLRAGHNLLAVVDPKGQTAVENFYDASDGVTGQKVGGVSVSINAGLSATTTDGNGHMRSYMHDDKGRPISVTEAGYTTTNAYNADGLLTSVTYPMGNTVSYTYATGNPSRSSQANLLRMTESPGPRGSEEASRVTSFTYDLSSNQVSSISSPNGLTVEHTLDSQGNIIKAKMNIPGMESTYSYNAYGQLISETDPESGTRTYNYYPEAAPGGTSPTLGGRALDPGTGGYLQQASTPLSFEHCEYDGNGNLTAHSNSEGVSRTWSVDKFNLVTSESATGPGSVSSYSYEASYGYDGNGNVAMKSESWGGGEAPVSRTVSYTYNARNNVLTSAEAGRGQTAYAYDGNENLASVTDPEGKSIVFGYDSRNLVSSFRRGEGVEATTHEFGYDGNGNLTATTDGRGKTTILTYDGYDRLQSTKDPLGNETVISRSDMGNLSVIRQLDSAQKLLKESVTVNDPMGRVVSRIEKLLDASGNPAEAVIYQYRYEENGRVVVVVDPLGRESRVIKNDLGKVIKEIDAAGNETDYYYEDGRGNMTRKVEIERRPDSGTETYVTRYEYNSFNKVTKIIDSLNQTWVFTYDEMGNLSGSFDPEGNTVSHVYDALGRKIKTERHFTNGTKQVTEFTYDNSNNIRSIKDSNGNVTQYDYDELNRLVRVTYADTTFIEYSYDGNSNIVVEKQRDGTRVENTYDDINRLVARNIKRATGVEGTAAEAYEYDGASRLVRAVDEDSEVGFVYDSLDRLLEEQQNGKAVKYTYDKLGNRTSLQYPNQRIIERDFDLLNRMAKVKQGTEAIADMNFVGRRRPGVPGREQGLRKWGYHKRALRSGAEACGPGGKEQERGDHQPVCLRL
jgi:YD repeat-containing protein